MSSIPSEMISLRNVEKYFEQGPTKTYVLRRVNIDIKEGEFISIMGPSGAGKSTLLHLLGMHDSAWSGEYHFLGALPISRRVSLSPPPHSPLHTEK